MKKFLLAILIPFCFSAASLAQVNYDLRFEFRISDDTLRAHDTATITGIIYNNGPAAYSGSLKFNTAVFYSASAPDYPTTADINYNLSNASFPLIIPPLGFASITIPINLSSEFDFWKKREDSTNIVIVWPDEYQDDNDKNDYGRFKLYILPDSTTSIAPGGKDVTMLSLFPNPAKNEVKISFETVRKGLITLTDISGRTLITQPVNAGSQLMQLPLTVGGKLLPQGLYFVTVQTDNQRTVRKLQIIH